MALASPPKLQTATEFAYDSIKQWIIKGEIAPDTRINLDELAASLQMSRVPVRGALDRLCAENLVVDIPRRGMIVKPLSVEHLESVFMMRVSLEAIAIVKAIENATEHDIESLHDMLDSQEFKADDIDNTMQSNKQFHSAIFALSGDETLCNVLENLWAQSNRYRYIFYRQIELNERIVTEHYRLLQCIRDRNKQLAVDTLMAHTWKSYETLVQLLGGVPARIKVRPMAVGD